MPALRALGFAALSCVALPWTLGCGRVGVKLIDNHAKAADDGRDAGDEDAGCALDDAQAALPSPSAHWPLDESTGTSAAEAVHGAPTGALLNFAEPGWTAGRVAGALSFDGVDDVVQVGAAGAVRTLSFWAKPDSAVSIQNLSPALFPSATGPDEEWSSPERAFSEGDGNATANLNLIGSRSQHWGGFRIPAHLPAGATVLGITVALKSASLGVVQDLSVELSWDGGHTHTDAGYGAVDLVGSSDVSAFGGEDQLWGRSWQPGDFSDSNFRVRVTLGGLLGLAASIDYVSVQVKFTDVVNPRNILDLNETVHVAFRDAQFNIAATNWPGATLYVNGAVGTTLSNDWNHVVITSEQAVEASQLRLGDAIGAMPGAAFDGLLDDVMLFTESFSPSQTGGQEQAPECEP